MTIRTDADAMMVVRAELCGRLESIRRISGRQSARDFDGGISSIRALATAYGMAPVARLAEAFERAVALSGTHRGQSATASLYLDRLHDAIGCQRIDEQACQAMIASVSIRMGAKGCV